MNSKFVQSHSMDFNLSIVKKGKVVRTPSGVYGRSLCHTVSQTVSHTGAYLKQFRIGRNLHSLSISHYNTVRLIKLPSKSSPLMLVPTFRGKQSALIIIVFISSSQSIASIQSTSPRMVLLL